MIIKAVILIAYLVIVRSSWVIRMSLLYYLNNIFHSVLFLHTYNNKNENASIIYQQLTTLLLKFLFISFHLFIQINLLIPDFNRKGGSTFSSYTFVHWRISDNNIIFHIRRVFLILYLLFPSLRVCSFYRFCFTLY